MGDYWKKTVECCNGMTFITKYTGGYQNSGKRGKKINPTSEQKQKYNMRKSIEKLFHLLLCNFFPKDYHLVLTYPKGTIQSIAESKSKISRFFRLYRDYCREKGYKAIYIYNSEIGANGNIHHHVILRNHMDFDYIEDMWEKAGGGSIQHRAKLWSNYDWYGLANYFVDKTKGGKLKDTHIPGERRYVPSKGLKQPKVTVERVNAERWRKPKAKKGYEIMPGSIRSGIDEITGGNFLKYGMRRII